jgi:hypothetical protein
VAETVWLNRDNPVVRQLLVDDAVIDHTDITRVTLDLGAVVLDSQTNPDWFVREADRLIMTLGHAGVAAGAYTGYLTIYDTDHPNGQVWGHLTLHFREVP